jgi:dihydroxyacetone kinase
MPVSNVPTAAPDSNRGNSATPHYVKRRLGVAHLSVKKLKRLLKERDLPLPAGNARKSTLVKRAMQSGRQQTRPTGPRQGRQRERGHGQQSNAPRMHVAVLRRTKVID